MEPQVRCILRPVLQLMARRASTVTAPRLVRPQTVTSMLPRTAIPTRTPGAVGRTPMEAALRNPVHQAGDRRIRAADHPPSAVQTEAGDPSRTVLAVGPAAVEAEVGAAAPVAAASAGELDSAGLDKDKVPLALEEVHRD